MSDNEKKTNKSVTTGATALISVLAVPIVLLTGLLLGNKHKK